MNSKTNLFGISNVRDLTKAAVVSALYIVITMVFAALSFGPIQFRFFWPNSIPLFRRFE